MVGSTARQNGAIREWTFGDGVPGREVDAVNVAEWGGRFEYVARLVGGVQVSAWGFETRDEAERALVERLRRGGIDYRGGA